MQREWQSTQDQRPYRGAIAYRQERGRTFVGMAISVQVGEQSRVLISFENCLRKAEVRRLPGIDIYSFSLAREARIQVMLLASIDEQRGATYLVSEQEGVREYTSPHFKLNIIRDQTQEQWRNPL